MKTKNPFEHTGAYWVRYSAYEWKKAPDGQEYLLPSPDAEPSVYDALSSPEQLVLDALNVGLLFFVKAPEEQVKASLLDFAGKYGLLGLMTALPTTPQFTDYDRVYLPKNPFLREESMDALAYMKLFFPFRMPDFHKDGVQSLWNVSGDERKQAALTMTFGNDPRAKAMPFMRDYGERYDWLKETFRDWTFTFLSVCLFCKDSKELDNDTKALYRQGLACFEGNAPTYHLELRDAPVMVWDFHSLLLAIKFLLSLKLIDTNHPLRMCEHCRKAFYAERRVSRFCSDACRNAHRKPD